MRDWKTSENAVTQIKEETSKHRNAEIMRNGSRKEITTNNRANQTSLP